MKVLLDTMSRCHCFTFAFVFVASLIIIFAASFKSEAMMVFNKGDSFSCAVPFTQGISPESVRKSCHVNLHRDRNVWLGRLQNLNVKNQMLLVYGFAFRNPPYSPSLMTYTNPNLTSNHIDANGNLILHNQKFNSSAANMTN